MMSVAHQAYGQVQRASTVEGASPHELIDLLMQSALARIAIARQLQARGEWEKSHVAIDKAVACVNELQGSLRQPDGDEIAANLYELYTYITTELLQADRERSTASLDNASAVLDMLQDAWSRVSPGRAPA